MKKTVIMWMKLREDQGDFLPQFQGSKSEAYHEFFRRANETFDFYFAFDMDAYLGDGRFRDLAVYKDGQLVHATEPKTVQAETIYHYSAVTRDPEFDPSPASIINSPAFKKFGGDKIAQYEYLSEFFPKTVQLSDMESVRAYVNEKEEDEKVVLKPVGGSSGQGVIVGEKGDIDLSDIDEDLLRSSGYMGQEFIDTSGGAYDLTDGVHDIRIMTMVDTVVLSHMRTPQDDSLICNTHRGAAMDELTFSELPDEITDFYSAVHEKITKEYPHPLYSMDLGIHADGRPRLIEINSHTAFPRKDFAVFDHFIDTLIRTLQEV